VLIAEGLHVPVMPFVDVVGKVAGVAPTQYGPSAVNAGVVFVLTTTFMVVTLAHCPAVGVKVYVVVPALAVLIAEGDHVPVMLFVDVVAKVAGVAPTQYGPSAVNAGVVFALTTTFIVVVVAH